MGNFNDITGQKYGRLTVIKRLDKTGNLYKWLCKCDCGNESVALADNLKRGHTSSCGCLRVETASHTRVIHGMYKTRIHRIWQSMLARCSNPNNSRHKFYLEKGITVCDKWLTFEGFYEDMADGYDDKLSIDRINNDKGYYKENCRWANDIEQNNNRSNSIIITIDGVADTLPNHCRKYNQNYKRAAYRIKVGWEPERAIKEPK